MGKREGRRGEWEETIWAYWEGSLMWAVFQPPLGHLRIGLGPGTLPYQGVFTACAGRTTLCESSLFCFTLSVYSFALLKWHIAPGQPHCSNCSLQKGDGLLCSVVQEGCMQANSPVSAAGRDLLTVYWCPLLQLTLLCLFFVWGEHCSMQYLTVLCFLWWLQYQDTVGRSVWISTPDDEQQMPLAQQTIWWKSVPGSVQYHRYEDVCLYV